MQKAALETVCEWKYLDNVLKLPSQIVGDFGHPSACYTTQASHLQHACFQEAGRMLKLPVGSVRRLTGSLGEAAQQTRIGTEVQRKKISWSPRGRHNTLLTGGKRNKGKKPWIPALCLQSKHSFGQVRIHAGRFHYLKFILKKNGFPSTNHIFLLSNNG